MLACICVNACASCVSRNLSLRYVCKRMDSHALAWGTFVRVSVSVCVVRVRACSACRVDRAVPAGFSLRIVCLLVACLSSQQHASVSQGRICTDNFTCCHTEIEAADQTFHLTQSQYTDTGPTSPSADPITPGAWQGSHWSANC